MRNPWRGARSSGRSPSCGAAANSIPDPTNTDGRVPGGDDRFVKEYRPPRESLWICLLFAAGWTAFGTYAVTRTLWFDGQVAHPIGAAVLMGSMCLLIVGFGVFGGFKLHTECVGVDHERIEFGRWGRSRVFESIEITSAEWRIAPARGNLVLRAPGFRFAIWFGDYAKSDFKPLIAALRASVPEAVQEGWPEFDFRYFPDDAERERRRREAVKPLSLLVVAPILAACLGMAAFVVGYLVKEQFVPPRHIVITSGITIVLGVAWFIWERWRWVRRRESGRNETPEEE